MGAKSRILVVMGTRPEAIKLAPLVKALEQRDDLDLRVCVTAQHRSMLDQVLAVFDIRPHYDLDLMRPGQGLAGLTAQVLGDLTEVIRSADPGWIVVQGDTTTAFAGGLAAYYERRSVAHVEAGLRTGNAFSPFPEEMNRRLVGALASLHFAPTAQARTNLLVENTPPERIHVTGNTVVDSLLWVIDRLKRDSGLRQSLERRFSFLDPRRKLVLVTGHRRESFGEPFRNICHALVDIIRTAPDAEILYPVHLNPNVRQPVDAILRALPPELAGRMHLVEPVDYLAFVYLLDRASLVITDSGGVQEEAPTFGKPVLVTRETTERMEAVDAGLAELVGTDRSRIAGSALALLRPGGSAVRLRSNPFGDGQACRRMVQRLAEACGGPKARLGDFALPRRRFHPDHDVPASILEVPHDAREHGDQRGA